MTPAVDRYTTFRVTRRRLLNVPTLQRKADYETYEALSVSQTPLSISEAWQVQMNMSQGVFSFPIAIQPIA